MSLCVCVCIGCFNFSGILRLALVLALFAVYTRLARRVLCNSFLLLQPGKTFAGAGTVGRARSLFSRSSCLWTTTTTAKQNVTKSLKCGFSRNNNNNNKKQQLQHLANRKHFAMWVCLVVCFLYALLYFGPTLTWLTPRLPRLASPRLFSEKVVDFAIKCSWLAIKLISERWILNKFAH